MSEGQTSAPPAPSQWALQQRAASPAPSGGGGKNAINNPLIISDACMETYGAMGQNNAMRLQINLFQQVFGSQNG
jgi:hypothetical protein